MRIATAAFVGCVGLLAGAVNAQEAKEPGATTGGGAVSPDAALRVTVSCVSKPGERQHCAADTSGGVAIVRSHGESACLLGKTWGYDDTGVWVSDGCSGEFQLGIIAAAGAATPAPRHRAPRRRARSQAEGAVRARGDLG